MPKIQRLLLSPKTLSLIGRCINEPKYFPLAYSKSAFFPESFNVTRVFQHFTVVHNSGTSFHMLLNTKLLGVFFLSFPKVL